MKSLIHLNLLFLFFTGACSAQSIAEQQDARVIENLVAAGSDISKPHNIDFFMFLPSKAKAKAAATEIEQLGYTIASVDRPPGRSQWQVHATRVMAPQLEAMTATTRALTAIAAKHGGGYDGWGTGVVE
ncbi:ribonuclease E inhibitor RraB [Luteimonas sp. BDR2-5]|uniref:ribonuclease E inhibitor RraB n=1 Tax=Proluteimonas luteida TaxID=2878685 RepID=UPI001E6500A7|nr:ribonuclease E inhibitor RraB [Luteimonas sp. BDR2-5]MCD9029573.1 ribonuclease E inhibitor RraB [Luteimonas sp. BDR2-5]